MNSIFDSALKRLLEDSGAAAAVAWTVGARTDDGTVLGCQPAGLLPVGADWPVDALAVESVDRDPAGFVGLLPASLRDGLAEAPIAARSFQLGCDLFLTAVWSDPPHSDGSTDHRQQTILDELGSLARLLEKSQHNAREVECLRAVVNGLDEAVVTIDPVLAQASVNRVAAQLLNLPQGKNPAADFDAALAKLADRAINRDDIAPTLGLLDLDPAATIEFTWQFPVAPTHLLIASRMVSDQGFLGRTWVFYDDSPLSQALDASEQARVQARAASDTMLDPLLLMEAVHAGDGRIVDFTYRDANRAACEYLGTRREDLVGRTLLTLMPNMESAGLRAHFAHCAETGQPVTLDNVSYPNQILDGPRRYDIRVNSAGHDMINVTWRDITDRFETTQRIVQSEQRFRLLAENSSDVVLHIRNGRIGWASPSVEDVLRAPPEYWIGRDLLEIIPVEDHAALDKLRGRSDERYVIPRGRLIAVDGTKRWVHVYGRTFTDSEGHPDGYTASLRVIDDEVRALEEAAEARRQRIQADTRYRRLMDNSAIGMALLSPDGQFEVVNRAICDFFGYDAETLRTKSWQELTAAGYLEADLDKVGHILAGRIDAYRMTKQYIHAGGHLIWGDLSVNCLRKPNGEVESLVSQIIDITAEVQARQQIAQREQQNRVLTKRLQAQTDRLISELKSAAAYVASILPDALDGPVQVSSRYLPSRELGGDCFDYWWIDDDHMIAYLVDVSGHGCEPALEAISVHTMLRAGGLSVAALLAPEQVLAELNTRFPMERQGGHYLTIWYGVYQGSTRTLRFASAGHPPALLLTADQDTVTARGLATDGPPVGMFECSEFSCDTEVMPPNSRLLLYSDGAYELSDPDGRHWSQPEFVGLCAQWAQSAGLSLDTLIERLRRHTPAGLFEDDCSLVLIDLP